jgi:hypothetical protein
MCSVYQAWKYTNKHQEGCVIVPWLWKWECYAACTLYLNAYVRLIIRHRPRRFDANSRILGASEPCVGMFMSRCMKQTSLNCWGERIGLMSFDGCLKYVPRRIESQCGRMLTFKGQTSLSQNASLLCPTPEVIQLLVRWVGTISGGRA